MSRKWVTAAAWFTLLGLAGCASTPMSEQANTYPSASPPSPWVGWAGTQPATAWPATGVIRAGQTTADPPVGKGDGKLPPSKFQTGESAGSKPALFLQQGLGLPELIALTVERNPRLAQVGWAVQAGLYPNPVVSVTGYELPKRNTLRNNTRLLLVLELQAVSASASGRATVSNSRPHRQHLVRPNALLRRLALAVREDDFHVHRFDRGESEVGHGLLTRAVAVANADLPRTQQRC